MTPFLKQVALHYYDAGQLDRLCFVFPNRRSRVFFTHYLSECVKGSERPISVPEMLTVSDLFSRIAGLEPADRVHLLLRLYDCYRSLNEKAESLDEFIFWGEVILSDFDDIDKYLVNPTGLLTNVADYKGMQDTYSYLTDGQREAIRTFMEHFHKDGRLTVDLHADRPGVKERFLQIWDLLLPLYEKFRSMLESEGKAYEGMIYRKVADSLDTDSAADWTERCFPGLGKFVFVGLNALNECEKKWMSKLRDAGLAEFCWDYSSEMIRDPRNKSSFFMADNVCRFPQAFEPDPEGLSVPQVHVVSVPSSVGQAKQLPGILSRIPCPGLDTAVVLPDEGLLVPVLNSLPDSVPDVNVTMGYPMKGSELYSLMSEVSALQLHLRFKGGEALYYHRQVLAIFSNSLFRASLDEAGRKKVDGIRAAAKYYIPQEDLAGHPLFEAFFQPQVFDLKEASDTTNRKVGAYLLSLVSTLAPAIREDNGMALELEFAREYYLSVQKLLRERLPVLPATWFRLLDRLIAGLSVPFRGEPLKGMQVMGPLETRALDFKNLIVLSCNEGIFPHRSVSPSFIPPELRKGFGLPTYEYQDAVWAYYFYRMIQRCSDVWLLYDSRAEHMKSGEESRFIKQLELHFGLPVRHYLAKAPLAAVTSADQIPKTEEDVRKIRSRLLSATALQYYLACPAKFYYHSVCGLKKEDEIVEALDAGTIGNVFHKTMYRLYEPCDTVTRGDLEALLRDQEPIRELIRETILRELRMVELSGRNLVFAEVVRKMVAKTLERDLEMMDACGTDRFKVLGLEQERFWDFEGFHFRGFLDRLDSFRPGELRIVDYKTGKVTDLDNDISDETAQKVIDALFAEKTKERPKIALQLFLYDMYVQSDPSWAHYRLVNSIYQTSELFVSPVRNMPLSPVFCEGMKARLSELLKEIADPAIPFRRTTDIKNNCSICDFKTICGR